MKLLLLMLICVSAKRTSLFMGKVFQIFPEFWISYSVKSRCYKYKQAVIGHYWLLKKADTYSHSNLNLLSEYGLELKQFLCWSFFLGCLLVSSTNWHWSSTCFPECNSSSRTKWGSCISCLPRSGRYTCCVESWTICNRSSETCSTKS